MALTKTRTVDKLEILEDGIVQVRESLRVFDDDGTLIGERYFRYMLTPGQDVTNERPKIRRICNAAWDAQTIADYQAKVAAAAARLGAQG